jgi:hypothetical protein
MAPTFHAIPILRVEHRFDETAPLYLEISRDGLVLHLSEHHGFNEPIDPAPR